MQFICYPKCTTCQKAQKWLDAHEIEYDIRHIKEENGTVSFLYDGTSTQLLSLLSSLSPTDFTVSDPDLEEVFWHYYAKEDV